MIEYEKIQIDPDLLSVFQTLLISRTGLSFPQRDLEKIKNAIVKRMISQNIRDPLQYYHVLSAMNDASEKEMIEFADLLVNRETYFFRDTNQFAALKNELLPEIYHKRLKQKTLKIWSAGCSTGEEPYSLAILLCQSLPDWESWNISIIGTDISLKALEKARKGCYADYAFRGVDPVLRDRFFLKENHLWKVFEPLRKMVSFSYLNLVSDIFPREDLHNIDLILCRNVFIYFDQTIVNRVIHKFFYTLSKGGFLMTAPAEIYLHKTPFKNHYTRNGVLIYQKPQEGLGHG